MKTTFVYTLLNKTRAGLKISVESLAGKVVEFIKNCVEGPRGYRIGLSNVTTNISYFNLN